MDVFDLNRHLLDDYTRFARSFTRIRATDIAEQVEAIYASGRFWPEPLIEINPRVRRGKSIADLAADGTLDPGCAEIFRPARPGRHSICICTSRRQLRWGREVQATSSRQGRAPASRSVSSSRSSTRC
jgi:hypothetical protein